MPALPAPAGCPGAERAPGPTLERLLKASGLSTDKMLATLDQETLAAKVRCPLPALCEGGFAELAENALAFGRPGRGKTHVVSAIGHVLVRRGYEVLFIPAVLLVQRLLASKKSLLLKKEPRRLDGYDAVIIDDIGYSSPATATAARKPGAGRRSAKPHSRLPGKCCKPRRYESSFPWSSALSHPRRKA